MISVIIPIFNAEKTLKKCVESLLNQKDVRIEIILVNDGSKDGSESICNGFKNVENVIVIHKANGGVSSARNAGLKISNGKFIMFVDADDYVAPDLCFQMRKEIIKGYDIVISGIKVLSKQKKLVYGVSRNLIIDNDLNDKFEELYDSGLINAPFAKLYRKEIVSRVEFDENRSMGEDLFFNLLCFERAKKISVIPYYGYYYVSTPGSATQSFKENRVQQQIDEYNKVKEYAKNLNVYDKLANKIDLSLMHNFVGGLQLLYFSNMDRIHKKEIAMEYLEKEEIVQACGNRYNNGFIYSCLFYLIKTKKEVMLYIFFMFKKFVKKIVRREIKNEVKRVSYEKLK